MTAAAAWPAFLKQLSARHGSDGLACRHEIYFLRRKGGSWRATGALIRDITLLLKARNRTLPDARVFAVATIAGASGMGTINRALAQVPSGTPSALLAHPRLKLENAYSPGRPRLASMAAALRHWPDIVVTTCVARHHLWRSAWSALLRDLRPGTIVLLHNDFDMMSAALLGAVPETCVSACVQHGIPTDEFFPSRAETQVVWGRSSAAAYRGQGYTGHCIVDGMGRGDDRPPEGVPQTILLLSQTHTPIYGMDLAPWFKTLAHELACQSDIPFIVLLHPGEIGRTTAYDTLDENLVQAPPHAQLANAAAASLVIGYSTTALFEAAKAGHYVASIDWPVLASKAAHAVASAPLQVKNAADILELFRKLENEEPFRRQFSIRQAAWMQDTFAPAGAFAEWMAQCTAP